MKPLRSRGFTLVEVMVALAITAIALVAGLKASAALTDNAVRFTRKGEVVLRALDAEPGLVLEVQDTGPGMTPAEAERLFDAFAQGDDSSTRAADGLGLGLTSAHDLTRLMGGRIEVETRPGVGSLFRVILPLQRVT